MWPCDYTYLCVSWFANSSHPVWCICSFFFCLLLSSEHQQSPFLLDASPWLIMPSGLQAFLSWGFLEDDIHGRNNPKAGKVAPGERWTEWNRVFTLLLWTQLCPEIEAPPWAAIVNYKEYSWPYKDLIFEVQIAYPSLSINLYQELKVVGMVILILWGLYLQNRWNNSFGLIFYLILKICPHFFFFGKAGVTFLLMELSRTWVCFSSLTQEVLSTVSQHLPWSFLAISSCHNGLSVLVGGDHF